VIKTSTSIKQHEAAGMVTRRLQKREVKESIFAALRDCTADNVSGHEYIFDSIYPPCIGDGPSREIHRCTL
jgi:hypothetical protein